MKVMGKTMTQPDPYNIDANRVIAKLTERNGALMGALAQQEAMTDQLMEERVALANEVARLREQYEPEEDEDPEPTPITRPARKAAVKKSAPRNAQE